MSLDRVDRVGCHVTSGGPDPAEAHGEHVGGAWGAGEKCPGLGLSSTNVCSPMFAFGVHLFFGIRSSHEFALLGHAVCNG